MKNKVLTFVTMAVLAIAAPLAINFEGTELVASPDPIGITTACHGHTGGIKLGQVFTEAQCKELLNGDLTHSLKVMDSTVKVPLSDSTAAAFSLFIMNVGEGNFRSSKALILMNVGDIRGACMSLAAKKIKDGKCYGYGCGWAGGKMLRGLQNRRLKERDLCLAGL